MHVTIRHTNLTYTTYFGVSDWEMVSGGEAVDLHFHPDTGINGRQRVSGKVVSAVSESSYDRHDAYETVGDLAVSDKRLVVALSENYPWIEAAVDDLRDEDLEGRIHVVDYDDEIHDLEDFLSVENDPLSVPIDAPGWERLEEGNRHSTVSVFIGGFAREDEDEEVLVWEGISENGDQWHWDARGVTDDRFCVEHLSDKVEAEYFEDGKQAREHVMAIVQREG